MSAQEQIRLLNMVIETQASRISEQEALIKDLQETVAELRSLKANLEETLEEFRRQLFCTKSEKTREVNKTADKDEEKKPVRVKAHDRKPKCELPI